MPNEPDRPKPERRPARSRIRGCLLGCGSLLLIVCGLFGGVVYLNWIVPLRAATNARAHLRAGQRPVDAITGVLAVEKALRFVHGELCDGDGNPTGFFRHSAHVDQPAMFYVDENGSAHTIPVAELSARHVCGKITFTFQALPLGIQRSTFDVGIRSDGTTDAPSRVRLYD